MAVVPDAWGVRREAGLGQQEASPARQEAVPSLGLQDKKASLLLRGGVTSLGVDPAAAAAVFEAPIPLDNPWTQPALAAAAAASAEHLGAGGTRTSVEGTVVEHSTDAELSQAKEVSAPAPAPAPAPAEALHKYCDPVHDFRDSACAKVFLKRSAADVDNGQGLTLVHFSAQLEPCLTHKKPYTP